MLLEIDYSENFKYSDAPSRVIQSAHWSSESVTLMTGCATYLSAVAWNLSCHSLEEGDEVSTVVDPGDGGGVVYRYGVVAEDQIEGGNVIVNHPQWGREEPCQKMYLAQRVNLRTLVYAPIMVISDDKIMTHSLLGKS